MSVMCARRAHLRICTCGAQLCIHTYFVNLYLVINCLPAPRSHMFHVLKETPRFNELVLCFLSFLLDTSDDDADDDKTRS